MPRALHLERRAPRPVRRQPKIVVLARNSQEQPSAPCVVMSDGADDGGTDTCRTSKLTGLLKPPEARAGMTGHNVRYVLLIGLVAVILLFAAAYLAA